MVIRWQDELMLTGWLERGGAKLTARDNAIPPIAFLLKWREARTGNVLTRSSGSIFRRCHK
jgi:hypothetical protein